MSRTLLALVLLACGAPLCAQAPAARQKTAAEEKKAAAAPTAYKTAADQQRTAAGARKTAKAAPVKPAAAKPAEEDSEEGGGVMIDSKTDMEETSRFNAGTAGEDEEEEAVAPGGMPSSYGQCKGVLNEAGRSILVMESPEDGTISFVQVTVGKGNVSWKLVDRIQRNAD